MTRETANRFANVVLAAAALGAVYVIFKTPPLKRLATGLVTRAIRDTVPAWLSREVTHAWAASGPGSREATASDVDGSRVRPAL